MFPESPLPPQGLIFKSLNQLRSRMDTLVQKPLIASTQMARFVFTLSLLCLLKACSLPEETFYIHITQGKRQFFVASIFFFLKFYKKLPLVLWKITWDGKVTHNGYINADAQCTSLVILSGICKHAQHWPNRIPILLCKSLFLCLGLQSSNAQGTGSPLTLTLRPWQFCKWGLVQRTKWGAVGFLPRLMHTWPPTSLGRKKGADATMTT